MKQKNAFTMIEVIFVIVIIGILSAVAIPKLAASRDDAIATTCINSASNFLTEVSLYYTVYGQVSLLSKMTNISIGKDTGFDTDIDFGNDKEVDFYCEGEKLLKYTFEINNSTVTLEASTLDPKEPPAAYIANETLIKNNFYRAYTLGGYSH